MSEHKRCPFCGGEGEVIWIENFHGTRFMPRCINVDCVGNRIADRDCGYFKVDYETEAEAWEAWDKRVPDPLTKELLVILVEIAKAEGRFSQNPLDFAENTIEDMQRLAEKGIAMASSLLSEEVSHG